MKLSDLSPNEKNPRKISDEKLEMLRKSIEEFGDISGICYNQRTGKLFGGHQRGKILPPDAEVITTQLYKQPTRTGTIAEGFILHAGEKFHVRIVDWEQEKELAAMVAANKQGGEWDFPALGEVLLELEHNNYQMDLTGYDNKELEKFLTFPSDEDDIGKAEFEEEPQDEMRHSSSQVRMVQLFFNETTHVEFLNKTQAILQHYGADNLTDLILEVVREAHRSHAQNE